MEQSLFRRLNGLHLELHRLIHASLNTATVLETRSGFELIDQNSKN